MKRKVKKPGGLIMEGIINNHLSIPKKFKFPIPSFVLTSTKNY